MKQFLSKLFIDSLCLAFVVLALTLFLAVATPLLGQKSYVYTLNKEGKETHKECFGVDVKPTQVTFIVNGTTYQVFYQMNGLWIDSSTNKIVQRGVQENTVIFWKTEKKAFYYTL